MTYTDRPAELVNWKNACHTLLGASDALPVPLESELRAYANRLDYALNHEDWQEEAQPLTNVEALEAIAATLLTTPDPSPIRDILRRNGR